MLWETSLSMCTKIIIYGPVKRFVRPLFIFWIIFLLDLELYRQIIGIPMGTNCAPLVCSYFVMREIS